MCSMMPPRCHRVPGHGAAGGFNEAVHPTVPPQLLELPDPGVERWLRIATRDDVPAIVRLLADDTLGAGREDAGDLAPYHAAFERISDDPGHRLVVVVAGDEVVGTLQLTILPGMARRAATRGQIEAVRVAASERGRGTGAAMVRWAIEEARRAGCSLVQLTSDTSRVDAHRFYTGLGFAATHVGFKLEL